MRTFVRAVTFASITFADLVASAAGPNAETIARAQFDRGLEAMRAGRFAEACPALAESFRLDPKPGALFTLAECEAKWGRFSSADAHYSDYLSWFSRMTPKERRMQIGRDRISERAREKLGPSIPRLTIRISGSLPANAVVRCDDVVLGAPSLGVPLPIDPGAHVVAVEVAGRERSAKSVTVAPGASVQVVLDPPKVIPGPPTPTPTPTPTSTARARPPTSTVERAAPLAAAGIGIVGLGVGASFGLVAMSKTSTMAEHCDGSVCDREGVAAADSAQTSATVSTVGFCVGLAGLAASAILWLMPSPEVGSIARGPGALAGVF